LRVVAARSVPAAADLVATLVSTETLASDLEAAERAAADAQGFEADVGSTALVAQHGRLGLLVGVGGIDTTPADLRKAGAAMARAARRVKHAAVDASSLDDPKVGAFVEGVLLGAYTYDDLRSDPKPVALTKVSVLGAGKRIIDRAAAISDAVNWARDQVNRPGGSLTPEAFAEEAVALAGRSGLKCKVMSRAAIERAKLGGLLGVNRGSFRDPRLVQLTYTPSGKAKAHLALVGKGITFDSGGLSIKPAAGMMTMKCDMAGGAAVLAAMAAIAAVKPKVKVTAFVPMTDNMTGPDATRPGDVLTARNGKTIEVLNTDAEGRLILADALSLASEAKPDAIVDCATLTGACMVALGRAYAGVMGNDRDWVDQVVSSADRAGELAWALPLPKEYRKLLDSTVADVKNIGGAHGGALTAGLFLNEFVAEGIPWAHIDLAGPAFNDTVNGEHPKGGTGYGVRTLVELAETFERS
jgi:leucyl aminopeptidase